MAIKPTTVPSGSDRLGPETIYLVLDDFGTFGRAYRETDERRADRDSIIANLLSGQYERPLQIIAFNTSAGFAHDVTAQIAREIEAQLRTARADEIAPSLRAFLDRASRTGIPAESCTSGPTQQPAIRMADAGWAGARDKL